MARMLALLGSRGKTAILRRWLAVERPQNENATSFVQLARLSIKGCIDCRRCWDKGGRA